MHPVVTGLATADPLTADTTEFGPFVTTGGEEIDVINLAFNPADRNLYGVEEGPAPDFLPTGQLVQIDRATGTATRVSTELDSSIHALAFDRTGRLFAAVEGTATSDRFVEMNPATGEIIQEIGPIGLEPVFGLAFDRNGVLFGTAIQRSSFETQLLTINLATGEGTPVIQLDQAVFDLAVTPVALCPASSAPCLEPALKSPFFGAHPRAIAIGDVNGDTFPDLAIIGVKDKDVFVLIGDGAGGFAPPVAFAVTVDWNEGVPRRVLVGDVTGDGNMDLVTANKSYDPATRLSGANISVLVDNGIGDFTPAAKSPFTVDNPFPGSRIVPADIALGDLNGDGRLDVALAIRTASTGAITVLLNGPP